MIDGHRDQARDGEPHEQRQASRKHVLDQWQAPDGQPRHRDVPRLTPDVELRPEREHEQHQAHHGRHLDPPVAPARRGEPPEHDEQRQADVAGCLVVQPAEPPGGLGHDLRREELVGSRQDDIQQIGREDGRGLDTPMDLLRTQELDGQRKSSDQQECGHSGNRRPGKPPGRGGDGRALVHDEREDAHEQGADHGAHGEDLLRGQQLKSADHAEGHAQALGSIPPPGDQLVEDDQEQRRRPDIDQVEVQRRVGGNVRAEAIEPAANERTQRALRVSGESGEASETAERDRHQRRDVVGEDRAARAGDRSDEQGEHRAERVPHQVRAMGRVQAVGQQGVLAGPQGRGKPREEPGRLLLIAADADPAPGRILPGARREDVREGEIHEERADQLATPWRAGLPSRAGAVRHGIWRNGK